MSFKNKIKLSSIVRKSKNSKKQKREERKNDCLIIKMYKEKFKL